uniref:Caldesmon 1b n=1 Tax=Tetraodon nigroviridis TaxID=99883 RepID=H3BWH2_TETNG
MDFERRRELRRQKREEMRLEAERLARTEDDEEEAARERRRRARQERLMNKEMEEPSAQADGALAANSHGASEDQNISSQRSFTCLEVTDEQALLERMAKREERRQRRMKEALERQRQQEPEGGESVAAEEDRPSSRRRARYRDRLKRILHDGAQVSHRQRGPCFHRNPAKERAGPAAGLEGGEVERSQLLLDPLSPPPALAEKHQTFPVAFSGTSKLREYSPPIRSTPKQHSQPERTLSRSSLRSSEEQEEQDQARLEAERKLEELKRRRGDAESEEFERMRQKQQEAEAELNFIVKAASFPRLVFKMSSHNKAAGEGGCTAEHQPPQRNCSDGEELFKALFSFSSRRLRLELRISSQEFKPFKCVGPRGSSLKIGERAEFLNRSAQKSTVKSSHSPMVAKIDNRLEQYTSAAQRTRSPDPLAPERWTCPWSPTAYDNIKSMWEKGGAFSSAGSGGAQFKEAAVMKTGVAGRINDWLNKTPESSKPPGGRPSDLKPVDVTNKRSLWENKGASPSKV